MNDNVRTQATPTPARRAGRAVGLCAVGAVLATGLLAPGTALAVSAVSAPTLSGDPIVASVTAPYSFAFTATGTPAPTCAVTAGTLPIGLALSSDCQVTGQAIAGGDYPFIVTASNGTAPDALLPTSIQVDQPPALTDQTVPHAVVDQPFDYQLPLSGYPAPTVTLIGPDALPDGLTLDPDGLIHGTPTGVDAKFGVGLLVSNDAGNQYYSLHVFVDGVPAQITSDPPPDVSADVPYSFQFTASGDPAPSWRIVGTLPYGLSFDSDNAILSGTTTSTGDYPIQVGATSFGGPEDLRSYTLHVVPVAPQVHNTPGPASLGQFYDFRLDTTGTWPYPTFSVDSGVLPQGLSLSTDGVVSGTPTQIGAGAPVTVRVSNGTAPDALVTFTIPVDATPPALSGVPASPASQYIFYSYRYGLTGKPTPTTAVTDGALPPGLTLSTDGLLYGTPSTPGTYTFTVTGSNGGLSPDASITSTIVIWASPSIGGQAPNAQLGRPYSYSFPLSSNPTPTVTLAGGTLPPGITLSTGGTLAGTPTGTAQSYSFTLRADNGLRSVTYFTTLLVTPDKPQIYVDDHSQAEGNSGTRPMTFTIRLSNPSTSRVTVHWSTANGTAQAGSDYVAASGTVTFLPGQTVQTVVVQIKGDRTKEPTETFHVRLSTPVHATIADGDALGRIVNDD